MTTDEYQAEVTKKILDARTKYPLQPILFVGSGLSIRWLGAPSWKGLLQWAIKNCTEIKHPINFFLQKENGRLESVASSIIDDYHSWAWSTGRASFPDILFDSEVPKSMYLKHAICKHLKSYGTTPDPKFKNEVDALSAIRPQSIITTNYDELLEGIFTDYQPVLGKGLITAPFANVGEIYKIHGTIAKPSSIILTDEDYKRFKKQRRYLTAKLLTFFAEHPILFIGYSIEDQNIQGVLSDLDDAMDIPGSVVENVFWLSRSAPRTAATEKVVQVSPSKGVRINSIETDDFSWVFNAFGHNTPLENVNQKVLRAILARSYHLVRTDIPRQTVEVDFGFISDRTSSEKEFAKLFGIADLETATEFSAKYCFNLTGVGKKLGYKNWHKANQLLEMIKKTHNIDLKASDNRYHCKVKTGNNSEAHMYSTDAVDLLRLVRDKKPYTIDL